MRRWRELSRAERWTLIGAVMVTVAMQGLLVVLPFRVLVRLTGGRSGRRSAEDDAIDRIAWAMRVVGRRMAWTSCLAQALAAQLLLRRAGLEATIELGAYRDDAGRMHFHAATRCGGRPVVGDRAMTPIAELP